MKKEEVEKICRRHRITARKYGGDDKYSWAVFYRGVPRYTGLSKGQVSYYKRLVVELNNLT